jgi:hypothetical protein
MRISRWAPLLLLFACEGTTGGARVSFPASAAGPADAIAGPLEFDNSYGFHVTLIKANLHIGAVYLRQTIPASGSGEAGCLSSASYEYVGQVLGGVTVDLLSPIAQPFPVAGTGIALPARALEIWLTGGDINNVDDRTVILDAQGTAVCMAGGRCDTPEHPARSSYPFVAQVTIARNHLSRTINPAAPSATPICKMRIVFPIRVDITPAGTGGLFIEVDPRGIFNLVDFSAVEPDPDNPGQVRFDDDNPVGPADISLFNGLRSVSDVYRAQWR